MNVEVEAVVATLSLLLSICLAVFYLRDRKHARFTLGNDYGNCLVDWHRQVVAVIIRARTLKRDVTSEAHLTDLAELSALIEQGRFFFPNIVKDTYGQEKPPAYRGYRNLALDFLVASYNLLREQPSKDTGEKLDLLQRHFTSVVFEIVRPSKRLETIRELTEQYFAQDKSFEDFLSHKDGAVIEHIWRRPR